MISPPLSRNDIGNESQLQGKALTEFLRAEMAAGRMMRRMVFLGPWSHRRQARYYRLAQTLPLPLAP